MIHKLLARFNHGGSRAAALSLSVVALVACENSDRLGPTVQAPSQGAPQLAAAVAPGIVFAVSQLSPSLLGSVYTGTVRPTTPSSLLKYLADVKAKGGRVLLKLHGGEATFRNADGTFNLDLWKTAVSRYRSINFGSYITDGTIVGHWVIDEPHYPSRWGNKTIPQGTVEAMAQHSKQLWPTLATIVNAPPKWFADSPISYVYLDAAWAMYLAEKSSTPATWAARQVTLAKRKGLRLFSGMNVLDGGNGTSGIRGTLPRTWTMSASELNSYGSAILSQSYVCGFLMWRYSSTYFDRPDIKAAMSQISAKARDHAGTSCQQ